MRLGRLSVPSFAKLSQETQWWQTAASRLAALLPRLSRRRSPGLGKKELSQRFYRLLEDEDVEEVFREFLVPPSAEESGLRSANGAGAGRAR